MPEDPEDEVEDEDTGAGADQGQAKGLDRLTDRVGEKELDASKLEKALVGLTCCLLRSHGCRVMYLSWFTDGQTPGTSVKVARLFLFTLCFFIDV